MAKSNGFEFRSFVVAYNGSENLTEVAEKLGLPAENKSYRSIGKYAAGLRKKLPTLKTLRNPVVKNGVVSDEDMAWATQLLGTAEPAATVTPTEPAPKSKAKK